MTRKPFNWPILVFIFVPLLIVGVDGVVLIAERIDPAAEKAIRLVKESNSRKENFTLQQYLYATVYHRKTTGEPITIEGWRASPSPESDVTMKVVFRYEDKSGERTAIWEANLTNSSVTAKNEDALDLSWH